MSRFHIELASPEDGPELLEILEEGHYPGSVSLLYTRRDDAYASLMREGEAVDIFVSRDTEEQKVAAFGVCALRTLYVDGIPTKLGYLFSLKTRKRYRGWYNFLHRGYAYSREVAHSRKIPFLLMSVVADNKYAIKLFEKKRSFMPNHSNLGDYEVYAMKTGMKCKSLPGYRFKKCEREDVSRMVDFLNRKGKDYQFFPVLKAGDFNGRGDGHLSFNDFYLLLDGGNNIAACGAVWDQRSYKQYIVKEYNGPFKILSRLSFLLPLFGYPNILAKPGRVLDFFTLSYWMVKDDDPRLFECFLRHISGAGRRHPFFVVGAHERNPLNSILKKIPHIAYKSKIYLVDWDKTREKPHELNDHMIPYFECGMM
ncbi:MAG: hypothetical protein GY950_16700 [bacterium]|nr:hypothetical protein [bacterium]